MVHEECLPWMRRGEVLGFRCNMLSVVHRSGDAERCSVKVDTYLWFAVLEGLDSLNCMVSGTSEMI